ncbi:MAG: glycosyltransferase family 9 protein [Acidobacteriota bacterium]
MTAPPRILIIRTSALGDIVHSLPTLMALRRAQPAAKIAWVVEAPMAPLIDLPAIDERLEVRLRTWRRRPWHNPQRRAWRDFYQRLRAFRADIALELMGNHKGGAIARLSGAPRRIGLARSHRREPSSALWINHPVTPAGDHAVDHALAPLTALGIEPRPIDFASHDLLPGGQTEGEDVLTAANLADQPFLLLHPGTGWPSKDYPTERWAEVVSALHDRAGHRTLLSSGPGEEPLAQAIAAAAGPAAVVAPMTSLAAMAWLLRRCRLALGGDTGPLHLAHALGTPVLMLYGPTDPRRHGPYGHPRGALCLEPEGSFSYRRDRDPAQRLERLPPATVVARALELLSEAPEGPLITPVALPKSTENKAH